MNKYLALAFFWVIALAGCASTGVVPSTVPERQSFTPPQVIEPYILFFASYKANLSAEARAVVAEAINGVDEAPFRVRTRVVGHTDRAESAAGDPDLSLRRAAAVKAEMVRLGVPASEIDLLAKGDTEPMVLPAAGVPEPMNRYVRIEFGIVGPRTPTP